MNARTSLRLLFSAVVASALAGCTGGDDSAAEGDTDTDTDTDSDTDTDTDTDTDVDTDTDTDSDTDTPAMPPADQADVCADPSTLAHLTPATAVDALILRGVFEFGPSEDVESWGTPCANASDVGSCLSTLESTVPQSSGWGYCGEGCTDYGLLWTRADDVGMADSATEVAAFLDPIDSTGDALFSAISQDYSPHCSTLRVHGDGSYTMEADFTTSDCPWTTETRAIAVGTDGAIAVESVLDVVVDDLCAGRRPEGFSGCAPGAKDAVTAHLVAMAQLEAAAVIAFERLAIDLDGLGAPAALVDRARDAAADEVRHVALLSNLEALQNTSVPPIHVSAHQARSLFDVVRENAVEGCVRETFGVVEALHRAAAAPSAELKAVFAEIAADETRHAKLSWDIHVWAQSQLSEAQWLDVEQAMADAWQTLSSELASSPRAPIEATLGAPSSLVAVRMAADLQTRLAA